VVAARGIVTAQPTISVICAGVANNELASGNSG
jgi:hypothetical protein